MANLAEKRQKTTDELEVPTGGIGDFAMSDDDFAVLEAEEAKKEFGEQGLAQFTAVAEKMAGHGRFGDDSVAHIQTGEIIVPLTLIENNPALKEQIFKSLRDSGIEDPEQYVVGNPANNINPETGLMEFGFFKKIFKGIKKVLKAVVKVVKKVAPIVLPIVLSMTPLGPIYGAALGSGIGTLIKGGSIKSALKAALIAGATGAVFQGVTGPESFGANVKSAAASPGLRFSETLSGAKTSLGNVFGSEANKGAQTFISKFSGDPVELKEYTDPLPSKKVITPGGEIETVAGTGTGTGTVAGTEPPGFFESVKGALTPGDDVGFGEGMKNAFFPKPGVVDPTVGDTAYNTAYDKAFDRRGMTPEIAAEVALKARETAVTAATAAAKPGFIRSYAPLAGAATLAAGAMGAFKTPEIEQDPNVQYNEDGTMTTGADLIAADPGKYLITDLGSSVLNLETGEYETIPPEDEDEVGMFQPTNVATAQYPTQRTQFTDNAGYLAASNPGGPFSRPYVQPVAGGGEIYPRRTGGIAPTEGTAGQDSVRAMLMPGEFVMTADAVRGMGRGDPAKGIQSMYSVMRNLEQRGRAA
jgi:hypothetical protein